MHSALSLHCSNTSTPMTSPSHYHNDSPHPHQTSRCPSHPLLYFATPSSSHCLSSVSHLSGYPSSSSQTTTAYFYWSSKSPYLYAHPSKTYGIPDALTPVLSPNHSYYSPPTPTHCYTSHSYHKYNLPTGQD